jgi:hypothetical protein
LRLRIRRRESKHREDRESYLAKFANHDFSLGDSLIGFVQPAVFDSPFTTFQECFISSGGEVFGIIVEYLLTHSRNGCVKLEAALVHKGYHWDSSAGEQNLAPSFAP